MSGINPKFLNVEKRVQYNIRLPQRLIDKYNSYAELTGNTTTNILNKVLDDFIEDKVVLNDYLDNVGGVTVKIPYAVYQKHRLTADSEFGENLLNYNNTDTYHSETYFAELFEVKKIPNNCDISNGESYVANKRTLLFDDDAIHSGIELFVYNIAETLFADATLVDKFDSFTNCLYCLYFEVDENYKVSVYLIDYPTAINLLSASGNDSYKNLIIACATELEKINKIGYDYFDELDECKSNLTFDSEIDYAENYEFEVERIEKELEKKYVSILKDAISDVANRYNSNNIIPFGSDIFNRIAIKEMEVAPDYFDEKVSEIVDKRIAEINDESAGKVGDKKKKKANPIPVKKKTNKQ